MRQNQRQQRPFGSSARPFGSSSAGGAPVAYPNRFRVGAAAAAHSSDTRARGSFNASRRCSAWSPAAVGRLTQSIPANSMQPMRQGLVNRTSNAVGLINAMEFLGVDRQDLLPSEAVDLAEALRAGATYVAQTSLRRLADRALALRSKEAIYEPLLERMKMSDWGPLGLAAQSAPSVLQSLEVIIRQYAFWTNSGSWQLELRPTTFVLRWSRVAASPGECALNEMLQARTRRVLSYLVGQPVRILETGLRHEAFGDRGTLDDLLGVRARYGQRENYLVLSREYLDETPRLGRAAVHAHFMRQLEAQALDGQPASFSERLHAAFERGVGVPAGLCRQAVAERLGMSEGTLKRRLRQELGSCYKAEFERFASRQVQSQLVATARSVEEIANAIGYTPSGLTRACKKWFGASPSDVRRWLARPHAHQ